MKHKVTFLERHWHMVERISKSYGVQVPRLDMPFIIMPEMTAANADGAFSVPYEGANLPWDAACFIVPMEKQAPDEPCDYQIYFSAKHMNPTQVYLFSPQLNFFNFVGFAGVSKEKKMDVYWHDPEMERHMRSVWQSELDRGHEPMEDEDYNSTITLPLLFAFKVATIIGNCHNIRLGNIQTDAELAIRQHECQRKHLPCITYKRIEIEVRAEKATAEHPAYPKRWEPLMPLHLVRGHFKDYEEGKGLFGKLHGRWWWTPHMAGTVQNGIAMKEYECIL